LTDPVRGAARPEAVEYAEYYGRYVARVPDGSILSMLEEQIAGTLALLSPLDERRAAHRYAPGKWSIKQVVGHLADTERVLALRALAFARGETARLFGFEQDDWVAAADFDSRPLASLLEELSSVRHASLTLFRGFSGAQWDRRGIANEVEFTVRSIPWILAGHELHHVTVLRERYL
jgi:hypothetical protein